MVEAITDMPAGTLGFRSTGEITDADFTDTLEPALEQAVAGGDVRLLLVTPPGFGGSDLSGWTLSLRPVCSDLLFGACSSARSRVCSTLASQ